MTPLVITLFAVVLAVSLAACGGSTQKNSKNATQESVQESSIGGSAFGAWSIEKEVDDFGDEVKGGHTYLYQKTAGKFSNTATVDSDCTIGVGIL